MTEDFDRIRPPRDRLLRRGDDGHLNDAASDRRTHRDDRAGREVLFSAGQPGHEPTGLHLQCPRCHERTPLDVRTALVAAMPLFVLLPWRQRPLFARCPACGHRSWLRIDTSA